MRVFGEILNFSN